MITCRELIEFLDDYVTGKLEPARREVFEEHLHVCPECVNYLQSYRSTITVSKAAYADDDPVPASVPEGLIKAILAQQKSPREPRS